LQPALAQRDTVQARGEWPGLTAAFPLKPRLVPASQQGAFCVISVLHGEVNMASIGFYPSRNCYRISYTLIFGTQRKRKARYAPTRDEADTLALRLSELKQATRTGVASHHGVTDHVAVPAVSSNATESSTGGISSGSNGFFRGASWQAVSSSRTARQHPKLIADTCRTLFIRLISVYLWIALDSCSLFPAISCPV